MNVRRALLLWLCCWSSQLFAHQQQEALTTVLFNDRSGRVEIMHRFYVHDAEHVINKIYAQGKDIIANEKAQRAFGEYVADKFKVKVGSGPKIEFDYLGQEYDGKFLWVYQVAPQEVLLNTTAKQGKAVELWFEHSSLQEFWAGQRNVINLEYKGEVKTLQLEKGDGWQSLILP